MAKEQKKTQYRKRRVSIFFAVLAALLTGVCMVLACTVFFRVEEVVVEGNQRYTQEEILSVASVERGSNLTLTAREQLESRIRESLPYVDSVEIHKNLPTTLRLTVKESQPGGVVAQGESEEAVNWLIDGKGRLLEQANDENTAGVAKIVGLEAIDPQQSATMQVLQGYEGQFQALTELMQALEAQGLTAKVTEIDASSPTEITMLYDGRLRVTMLINADFSRKMVIFRQIADLLGDQRTGTVNLKTADAYYSPGG